MIVAFADAMDVVNGWRDLDDSEFEAAKSLIERASAYLLTMLTRSGISVNPADELQAINLKTVTCNLVKRSLMSGDLDGVSGMSQSIGATSVTVNLSNPDGSFYLTRAEKQLLGIGDSYIGSIRPKIGDCCGGCC